MICAQILSRSDSYKHMDNDRIPVIGDIISW